MHQTDLSTVVLVQFARWLSSFFAESTQCQTAKLLSQVAICMLAVHPATRGGCFETFSIVELAVRSLLDFDIFC